MGYIFVDREKSGGESEMRQQMRRQMRSGGNYRNYGGSSAMMREEEYNRGYRAGYRHGYEDSEDDGFEMRRSRDSRGRYE